MPAYPCCERRVCDICLDERRPQRMEVVLAGFAGLGSCDNQQCENGFDGTYILDFEVCLDTQHVLGIHRLTYSFFQENQPCTLESVTLHFWWDDGQSFPKGTIEVNVVGGSGESYNFRLEGDDENKPDCRNIDNLDIPFESQNTFACDASGATATASSL